MHNRRGVAAAVVLTALLLAFPVVGQRLSQYPWALLDGGTYLGPVYSLACGVGLSCTADAGAGFVSVSSAPYASSCGSCGSADTALVSMFAVDAGRASLAGFADYARDAGLAGRAFAADFADDAGRSLISNFSDYAADAGYSANAGAADFATFALDAGRANRAALSDYAADAGFAELSNLAASAQVAGLAAYALDAGLAGRAVAADLATAALWAGDAGYSAAAGTAALATFALDAGQAGRAGVADFARDAGSAASADLATTALWASDAGNVVCTGCIIADRIGSGAVTRLKIGLGEIDNTRIADGGIVGGNIIPGGIGTPQLASQAVTNGIIGPNAITEDKIDAGAITATKILDGAVLEGKIALGAVTVTKIGAGAVTEAKLGTGAVTVDKIGTGAVTTAKIDNLAVTASQLADSAVTASKISSRAVTWPKLDNGLPFTAWDEGVGGLMSSRIVAIVNGTAATVESGDTYRSITPTASTTDFYFTTNIQFRTTKDLFAVITYRCRGTGWRSSDTIRLYNIANTAQNTTAEMVGDGNWHTAVFDISAFTGTGTVRFDFQDSGQAIGSGATLDLAYIATGIAGSGGGVGAVSYRGAVGIGTATPGNALTVGGATAQYPTLFSINETTHATSRRAAMTFGANWLVGQDSNGNGTKDFFIYDGSIPATRLYISTSGNVGIANTAPPSTAGFRFLALGTDTNTKGVFQARDGTVTATLYTNATSTGSVGTSSNHDLRLVINDSERARLTTGGRFAINATSVSGNTYLRLGSGDIQMNQNTGVLSNAYYDTAWRYAANGTAGAITFTSGTIQLQTAVNNASGAGATASMNERLRVANGGNISIGVAADGEEKLEVRTGSSAYGLLHSNGTIKLGSYISTAEAQFGTKSNHNIAFFTNNGAGRLRITATGEVRLPDYAGGGTNGASIDNNGRIIRTSMSDLRMKEGITDYAGALDAVLRMRPVRFQWKDKDRFGSRWEVGFIAQEMMACVPEAVWQGEDGFYGIDSGKLLAVVVGAIQELFDDRTWMAKRIQELEDRAQRAEDRLAQLEARLTALEAR